MCEELDQIDLHNRVRDLLKVYGSYTRELRAKRRRFKQISEEFANHSEWPRAAARACGISEIDPKHTAVEELILELSTLPIEIKELNNKRAALGLDEFIGILSEDNRKLIELVFVKDKTYEEAGKIIGLTKSGIRDRVRQIIESSHLCG